MQALRPMPDAAAGFTLLELLVALVVLGLVMVAVTQGIRFGVQAWQVQARTLAERGGLDAVDRMLRGLIERADPGSNFVRGTIFDGTPHGLAFITELPIPGDGRDAGQVDATLGVDGAHHLVLAWQAHDRRAIAPQAPARHILLDEVDLAYWAPAGGPAGAGWQPAWRGRALPGLVRIRLVFLPGSRQHYPDIVARPMRDASQS